MPIKLYNTLTKSKEEFIPMHEGEVRLYSCGPTVYNYPHIGNYRAYIFADVLKKTLEYGGYKVHHVMNLTDVDDKTIRDSQKEGKSLKEFTEFYTEAFYKDIELLNIQPPEKFTKATDYIEEMVKIIETLLAKGLAYKSKDGSVYYDIRKFPDYGKLSGIKLEEQKSGASGRVDNDEYDKDNVQDFALWKAWDESDGDVFWEPDSYSTLGKGRPGWHIECSAMSMASLGEEIDIHTGGVDNIFPHHENEIAQSEGATDKQFVRYWMHNEWVLVENKKMAKSLGNFYTLKDIQEKGIHPVVYRFWLLMASYRTKVNFSWEALQGAQNALKRLYDLYLSLGEDTDGKVLDEYQGRFQAFLEDDLDTPRALTVVWDLLKDKDVSNADKKATLLLFDKVLGLGFENIKAEEIPDEVQSLARERTEARKAKDFAKSDELREKISELGYEIKDTEQNTMIRKK